MRVRNIIFDLGGVIIDIDYKKTSEAFKKLGAHNFDDVYSQCKQDSLFDDYDIGNITSKDFRAGLCKRLDLQLEEKEFDHAWNAMLGDLPLKRLVFIKELKTKYKTFLFSNTNEIHLKEVFNICKKQNGFDTFKEYFDKEYYSNIFGKRKPHPESFTALLKEHNLRAEETVFIDDSIQHVLGARKAGINAIHLANGKTIFDLLGFIKEIEDNLIPVESKDNTSTFKISA